MLSPWKVFTAVLVASLLVACGGSREASTSKGQNPGPSDEHTIVARYADTTLTLTELDSAFAATAGGRENAADSTLRAYRTFLDQYVNFRLKVRAARDAGMDTLESVQRDIHNYLQEMARPRLMRQEVYEPILRTLYERRKQEVDVSHILIRPSGQDSLAARRTLQAIVDSLNRGVSFAELAHRNSDDPSAQQEGQRGYRGHLGYLQAGQVVTPFENRMYALEPGQVSEIFRTQFGYHVLKVHGTRDAEPPIQLSHILLRPSGDSTETRHLLDSLRTAIVEGETTFASAARKHSGDKRSAVRGGELGSVNPKGLPEPMQRAVSEMDSVGAVSDVVRTRFGYHLLKLTGREEEKSFDEAYEELKKLISGQPRVEQRKDAFARDVWTDVEVTVDTTRLLEAIGVASVDSLARPLLSRTSSPPSSSPSIASLGDSTYTVEQLAQHLTQTDGGAQMTIGDLISSFLTEKAFQFGAVRFARRTPSLASEIKRYREGVLLFRYMQDSVWTAAAQDTAGLRATFEKNQEKYRFPERVRTIVLRAPTDSLLSPYRESYTGSRSIKTVAHSASTDSLVSVDTAFVTDRSADVYQPVRSVKDGGMIGPTAQRNEWLLMIRDTRLPARKKTFEEARSSVIQDYQNIYEDRVIKQLRDRYDVEMYPERLRAPFGAASSSP